MGYPDLIHLIKSPHWLIWVLSEAALVLFAVLIFRFAPGVPAVFPYLLILAAVLMYSLLSLGIAFVPDIRRVLVRPEALIETRHYVFLVLGGLLGLLWAMLMIAGVLFNTASFA